jgi:hypothetical protein
MALHAHEYWVPMKWSSLLFKLNYFDTSIIVIQNVKFKAKESNIK